MSSSRHRDDRAGGGYPPRHALPPREYYSSSSNSQPLNNRPPHYGGSSSFTGPPGDSSSRYAPTTSARNHDDRGNFSGYSGGGNGYAGAQRFNDRRDRAGTSNFNERAGRDSRPGGDHRARSPVRGDRKPGGSDRFRPPPAKSATGSKIARGSSDPRASSRSSYRDLSPPESASVLARDDSRSARPASTAPKLGKASYERSTHTTRAERVPAPRGSSPGMEPGELLSTPETKKLELPHPLDRDDRNSGEGHGNGWDRKTQADPAHGPGARSSASRAALSSLYRNIRNSRDTRPISNRRGYSPPPARGQSPAHRSGTASGLACGPQRRSSSPRPRRASQSQPSPMTQGSTLRGRSPTRSPRTRSVTPSPPLKAPRRRGSSCSSAMRSPSPPASSSRRQFADHSATARRSRSRSRSVGSERSRPIESRSRTASGSPRAFRRNGTQALDDRSTPVSKADKRPRSPTARDSERTYDKKAKVSPQHNHHRPTETTISDSSTSVFSDSTYRAPPPSLYNRRSDTHNGPAAPTEPRALRQPLASQQYPGSQSNGLLPSGAKFHVDVSKGPKPKAGFAPIKTTQVAGPSAGNPVASAGAPAPPSAKGAGGIKKFFPGEEEEEDERKPAKAAKEREGKEKFERERERLEKEKELERKRAESEQQRLRNRYKRASEKMDIDRERYPARSFESRQGYRSHPNNRDRSRSRSSSRSLGRSSSRSRSRSRGRSRSRSRSRTRSPSRSRSRERRRAKSKDRERKGADNGWLVRGSGDVPPPRARPLNEGYEPDARHATTSARSRHGARAAYDPPSSSSTGRRYDNAPGSSRGDSYARPPASYERSKASVVGGPRNSFGTNVTSSNAIVPGVVERKWGTPARTADRAVEGSASDRATPGTLPRHAASVERDVEEPSGWSRHSPPPRSIATRAQDNRGTSPSDRSKPQALDSRLASPARSATDTSADPAQRNDPITNKPAQPSDAEASQSTDQLAAPSQTAIPAPIEYYERIVQVGEGTYGKVYKARNVETGELVAMKRIRMESEKDGFPITAVREIKLLQNLRHPNVVDLAEMLVSKGHVYMVMEYMDHDLTGILNHPTVSFTPAHLKSLMKQFLEGLGFIHRRGVLHRDLKGSNILLGRSGELKIADFGLARFFARGRNNDYTNRVITQWYKPPELLFGATVYGEEVDMWSAGCIFLELFARRPVFQGQDEIHQLEVIFKITGTPTVEDWPNVQDLPWYELVKPKAKLPSQLHALFSKWLTPAGLEVADRLLSLNPAGRPTADEALRLDYFVKEEPQPELPDFLSTLNGSWHEFESKRARRKAKEEA
ncbi:uncharacterized protein JCM15063_002357 [Sporobolomyces koalae]|uniref:uncharacterized protein n=1 Tax=Sporobolomyces koalae TaxID=500713 RepID=UPI00316B8FE4